MSSKTKTTATKEEARPALVPKLRFPEFRNAVGWASEPMSKVYSFKGNNSLSRDKLNYVAGLVKNIHYGDIHTKLSTHFDITKELVPFINESEEGIVHDENLCAEGDMIFADASEDMADIGKSIEIVSLNGERVVSGLHTILARRTGNRIALGFGGHLFKSGWVRAQIQKEAQGAKVLGISANRMRNLRLPLPPPAEQQKIAECLSSVDELMAAQARKVDALKTHKKGLMQQLFPREGDDCMDAGGRATQDAKAGTQPRLRFPEFQNAGEWKPDTLENLCTAKISYGIVQAGPHVPNGMPYIKSTDLNSELCLAKLARTSDVIAQKYRRSEVVPGDVVFSLRGNIGVSQIVPKDIPVANLTQGTARIRPQGPPEFYFQALRSPSVHSRILAVSKGSTFQEISLEALRNVRLFHPEIDEQQRIASCLSSLDALITLETQKLEALKTHKKGLMQQLFPSVDGVEA